MDSRAYIDRAAVPNGEWGTPIEILMACTRAFGSFNLDPAANCGRHELPSNYVCTNYYCIGCDRDGLQLPWESRRVFLNPPYDKSLKLWVAKCAQREANLTCALLPVRTGRPWWREDTMLPDKVIYLPGRLTFVGAPNNAPFDSAIVLWWKPLK